ncbi:uncharacterized protein LOC129990045 [Argiope bruennichi]|uniref:Synaptosomal-associated protein 47 n=1 Tax=Argiope bruennichi TaxID=94029 RepID=A0A8T0G0N0_ARGBR|nr:uncharacterized protein LOC129990045 [Argiope bruennichi]XP_055954096.1 uncharacterized protein LOC129990045 [Argiope bruennichi]KAF8795379.1 Synaptosomal-associated protein 47 like protein [Argiope bruennichi]
MATQQAVLEENCSYFHSVIKKWISGTFTLREHSYQFQGQENKNKINMHIPLSTICGIEKRQSSFIYACLVITIGSEKHWFSSFPNRDTVYNLLELFWRGSLLSKSYKTSSPKPKGDTPLGKELLSILHESESNLVTAANALVDQGRQLQESQVVLEDVNTDLAKAEKVLKTFNFTQSILAVKQSQSSEVEEIKTAEAVRQKHYKVTFTFSKTSKENWEKGTLIIADEIVLLDEHQNRRIVINRDTLEKFQIITPWEFCLVYSSEWVSKSCFIMCPQLSGLLKYLNSIPNLKTKIVFEESTEEIPSCSSNLPNDFKLLPLSSDESIQTGSSLSYPNSAQIQSLAEEGVISDGDIEEISSVLNNLQVLASEVSWEQKQQMEQINSLITDVEKTELRMKTDIKNIKKVT